MNWTSVLLVIVYGLVFLGAASGLLWWSRRQRGTRLPFSPDMKLVRMPGETLIEQNRKFWEEDALVALWAAGSVPPLVGSGFIIVASRLSGGAQLVVVTLAGVVFLVTFVLGVRWFVGKTRAAADRYLGYFGERIVAECLEPLKRAGWHVFHDVPGESSGAKFNLDHVAVGPQGVFAIETKTRRKGRARPGTEDHRVTFDGRKLIWPWGEDTHGLEQVERNALWLTEALRQDTGDRFHVTPILTLPGWWIDQKPGRDSRLARVTNPKGLPKFLPSGGAVLTPAQISIIAAKLEARCRTVAY